MTAPREIMGDVETGELVATLQAGKGNCEGRGVQSGRNVIGSWVSVRRREFGMFPSAQLQATLSRHSDVNRMVLFGTYLDDISILVSPQGNLLLTVENKERQSMDL